MVNITTVTKRQYCVMLDPVDDKGSPQFGRKKLMKGEKSFFMMPGEKLERGIQDMYILGEDEGLILKAVEGFVDSVRCGHVDIGVAWGCTGCRCTPRAMKNVFLGIFVGTRQKMGLNLVRCAPADEIKR